VSGTPLSGVLPAFALIIAAPALLSFDQFGTKPQRTITGSRRAWLVEPSHDTALHRREGEARFEI
jgi:hypothetical protein